MFLGTNVAQITKWRR